MSENQTLTETVEQSKGHGYITFHPKNSEGKFDVKFPEANEAEESGPKWTSPENLKFGYCYFVVNNLGIEHESVFCPNCNDVFSAQMTGFDSDAWLTCKCCKIYTPLHTPQNYETIGTEDRCDMSDVEILAMTQKDDSKSNPPNYVGCWKRLKVDSVPENMLNKMRELLEKLDETPIVHSLGIVSIRKYAKRHIVEGFICQKLYDYFGLELESSRIDLLSTQLFAHRKDVATHYPQKIDLYDQLLKIDTVPDWTINRQGYVKFLMTASELLGYKLHTPDSGIEFTPDGGDVCYNGICQCCNESVYGLLSG